MSLSSPFNSFVRYAFGKFDELTIPGFSISIKLGRFPTYYIYNVFVPVVITSILGLFASFVPPGSDKINMAITILLGFFFIQSVTAEHFPKSDTAPLLAIYVLNSLLFSTLNLSFALIVTGIDMIDENRIPNFLLITLFTFLSIFMLCKRPKRDKIGTKESENDKNSNSTEETESNECEIERNTENNSELQEHAECGIKITGSAQEVTSTSEENSNVEGGEHSERKHYVVCRDI